MKHSSSVSSSSFRQQRGFVFKMIHSLILVVGVVTLVVLYKAGKLPFINYRPNLSEWNLGSSNNNNPRNDDVWEPSNNYIQAQQRKPTPVIRDREDTRYTTNRYAVQVAAGYDSRQLYGWRDALAQDGYDAYLVSLNTPRGLMFKLRVGAFSSRKQAETLQTKLRSRYPANFGASFVVEGD
ncbi:SPOR domain-containing protein [Thiothrix winogradskyi]|uniref:SPOR domain-containing protein n=1 Tax=Thiothrix winogradskyi TaxID=96472 RepID=A0ABY3T2T5_9GAMM|nr:SPOR domain-containing protein [Thiothrix winogradskyi]UJS25894.1 SPOR domain-containing protein [Thiothrix winogradskyi]